MRKENRSLVTMLYNIETGLFIAIVASIVSAVLWIFMSGPFINVSGDSMNPTYHDGDCLTGVKVSEINELSYGDVIVFRDPESIVTFLIKRVIGLPGDTIYIEDSEVYRNDQLINEDFQTSVSGNSHECVTVGENEVYVLGDNRDHSRDSRTFGCVNVSEIKYIVTGESSLSDTWIYSMLHQFTDTKENESSAGDANQ